MALPIDLRSQSVLGRGTQPQDRIITKFTIADRLYSVVYDEELSVQSSSPEELSAMAAPLLSVSPTLVASPSAVPTSFFSNASHFRVDRFTQIQATNVTLNTTSAVAEARGVAEGVFISEKS